MGGISKKTTDYLPIKAWPTIAHERRTLASAAPKERVKNNFPILGGPAIPVWAVQAQTGMSVPSGGNQDVIIRPFLKGQAT
jgi:hypothetical protein